MADLRTPETDRAERAEPAAAGIQIRGLTKVFGPAPQRVLPLVQAGVDRPTLLAEHGHALALRHIDLDIAAGQVQVVMGLSGSGKSTLLRHINRLIEPTAGQVLVTQGEQVHDVTRMDAQALRAFRRGQVAMVFQRFALLPHLNVLDNAAYGLRVSGMATDARQRSAREWLARVGLQGQDMQFPDQLSGGMQQRLGLARALANNAPILLMDEPFSALDPVTRADMQGLLADLQRALRKTVVFITHDLDEALRLGDRVAILRDGELVQQGAGEDIVLRPADAQIAQFVRGVNRGQVLRCASLVVAGARVVGPDLPADMLIADAARQLSAENHPAANVSDSNGRHLGLVHLAALVAAMTA